MKRTLFICMTFVAALTLGSCAGTSNEKCEKSEACATACAAKKGCTDKGNCTDGCKPVNNRCPEGKGEECCKFLSEAKKIITVKATIKPEKVEDFMKGIQWFIEESRKEAGCISFDVYRDRNNPNVFFYFEEWKDEEAVVAHGNSAHVKTWSETSKEYHAVRRTYVKYDTTYEIEKP